MPRAKYTRRSQRNRRRTGITKFFDAPFNGPATTEITVSGAGSDGPAGVNGDYPYDANGLWQKPSATQYTIVYAGGLWAILRTSDQQVFYECPVPWPPAANPPKTGWIVGSGDGVAPPPTLDYL